MGADLTIPPVINQAGRRPEAILKETAAKVGLPPLKVHITTGAASGGSRVFTLKVKNLDGKDCRGLYKLEVFVSESAGAGPGGTQTAGFTTGTVLDILEVGRRWTVLTSADGQAVLELTYTGTRAVNAAVLCGFEGSDGASI